SRLLHCHLDPLRRVGETGLRIDGIPCDEGNHLPALFGDHVLPLISSEVDLSFLDYLRGNFSKLCRMEDLHQGLVRCPGPPGCVREDLEGCYHVFQFHMISLAEPDSKIWVHQDLKLFPVAFQPCRNSLLQGYHEKPRYFSNLSTNAATSSLLI